MSVARVVVLWDAGVPTEVRAVAEPLLADALAAGAPAWCVEMSVVWRDAMTDAYASVRTQHEYRRATLTVGPGLLSLTPSERAEVLQHEVLHIAVQPVVNVVDELLEALPDLPPPLAKWAREQARKAMEGTVCDLTAAVCALRARSVLAVSAPAA